jgi:ABC-type Fe3+ transport system substrate-binding protein
MKTSAGLLVLSLLGLASASPAVAASDPALLAAARAEGKVVVYGSWPAAAMAALSEQFQKETGIPVEFVPLATGPATERFLTEIGAGIPNVDVFQVSDLGPYIDFAAKGLLAGYQSPEYEAIPAQYKDEQGRWVILAINAENIAYNTDLIAAADAPKGWQDLLNPALRGTIGIPDAKAGGTGYLFYYAMRSLYGPEFHDQLAALEPQLYVATAAQGQAVVSGEAAVAAGLLHYTALNTLASDPSAPIALVWPEPVPLAVRAAAISAKAPRPNAARVFMDFVASAEGQTVGVTNFRSISPRSDLATEGLPDLSSLKTFLVGADQMAAFTAEQPGLTREFEEKYLR